MAVTIKDVAERTGLSISTISKYLNGGNLKEKNRKKVAAAIAELGFKPNDMARGLKNSRTFTIGVLLPSFINLFFASIVSGIEARLQKAGYGVIVCEYREDPVLEVEKLQFFLDKKVDGILAVPSDQNSFFYQQIIQKGTPLIFLDRLLPSCPCSSVVSDNEAASYEAVFHLFQKGHRDIAILCGPERVFTSQERLRGYLDAHRDWGISPRSEWILYGKYDISGGYQLIHQLWEQQPKPTAVLVTNYELSIGAIMAFNHLGISIPEDLSVVAFDNLPLSEVIRPKLTTVCQSMEEISASSAELLLKNIQHPEEEAVVLKLKTTMLEGGSVKPIG